MYYYRYKLIAPTGKVARGIAKLPYSDVLSATAYLERDGSLIIYVKSLNAFFSLVMRVLALRWHRRISRGVLAEFLSNVALMLRSGVPLITALEEMSESAEVPELRSDLRDIIRAIKGGMTFSEAASNYRHIFPRTVYYLIRMGEETGKLEQMLQNAAEHLKRVQTIVTDTKQALLYPSFVFLAMGAGFLFWFYYVVPKIVGLFREMEVELPTLTVYVLKISEFIQAYIVYILVGLVLVVLVATLARRKVLWIKRNSDWLLLKTPVAGSILHASILAFISEYFALLLNAGIEILQSVAILKDSMKNEIYRGKLDEIHERLTRGEGVAGSFKSALIFPPFVVRMIHVGEMSGTLTEQLDYVADEYRSRLSVMVATIGKSIEPLVLIVAGSMFAVIIGALLLPIYDLVSRISS
jgi:general secretion pathway protein F/type IV pilus assembly protein PilC